MDFFCSFHSTDSYVTSGEILDSKALHKLCMSTMISKMAMIRWGGARHQTIMIVKVVRGDDCDDADDDDDDGDR